MKGSKEYFLKLSEYIYDNLPNDDKLYLNHLGMQVKQKTVDADLEDDQVKAIKKEIAKKYDDLEKYLFEKRNK